MSDDAIAALARQLGVRLGERKLMCATAESCTGGLVAGAITDIAGSSGWFDRGFVTYSNEAKMEMLGVPEATLAQHGAVSEADGTRDGRGRAGAQPRARRGRHHRRGGPGRRHAGEAGRHGVLRVGSARRSRPASSRANSAAIVRTCAGRP